MTAITRVGTVIVPVTDQDRAPEFFVEMLGFEKRLDGEFAEEGVDADEEVLRMGEYVPPMFTFRDPDGNRFRVVERD